MSTSVERLAAGLERTSKWLGDLHLEPKQTRTDWAQHYATLDQIVALAHSEMIGVADTALAEVLDDEQRERIRGAVADTLGDVAGLMMAAGRRDVGLDLIKQGRRIGEGTAAGQVLVEGEMQPAAFVAVIHAWWLFRNKRRREAVAVARTAMHCPAPALVQLARQILEAPEPLESAPSLYTINGIGTRIYGARDHREDGSYVTTRFFTILYVPIVPIDAFRVAEAEDNSYYFYAKERLSSLARFWRWTVLVGFVGLIVSSAVSSYYSSTGHRLGEAIAVAQEAEENEDAEGALAQYSAILEQFPDATQGQLEPVITAFVRLGAAGVASPLTPDRVVEVEHFVRRYDALPPSAHVSRGPELMVERLETWAGELGDASPEAARAQLDVLSHAARLAKSGGDRDRIEDRRHAVQRTMAERLAQDWPVEAIRQFVSLGTPEDMAAAGGLLETLGEGPSIWVELTPVVQIWANSPSPGGDVDKVVAWVQAASERAQDPERAALLEARDEAKLAEALAATPGDQEVAAALADVLLARGAAKEALATLEKIGSPGRMTSAAQAALANVYVELGRGGDAADLLERVMASRLPAFDAARRAYFERLESLRESLVSKAQRGQLPKDIETRLLTSNDAEQGVIFSEWLSAEVDKNTEIKRLQDAYTGLTSVVGVAIQLGTIQLRRANEKQGAERESLLAAAERAFLAIGSEGAGIPSYHLGLGRVYHRLGKPEEGEAEFASLLEDPDRRIHILVARAYRELGLEARAREVAQSVYAAGEDQEKFSAAELMSVLATDDDEREDWLRKGDQNHAFVKLSLLELEGDKLARQGDDEGADAKYAEAVAQWKKVSDQDSSVWNNAAVATLRRYGVTGKVAHRAEAEKLFLKAKRLAPDNALTIGNLSDAQFGRAAIEIAVRHLKPALVRLEGGDAITVLDAMRTGPLGEDVRSAMQKNAALRRALRTGQEFRALAPKRAGAYGWPAVWAERLEDDAALRELVQAAKRADVDRVDSQAARAEYLDGSSDADSLSALDERLVRLAKLAERAARHKPSLAVVRLLTAGARAEVAELRSESADARAALAELDGAAVWHGLDLRRQRIRILSLIAILETRERSDALAQLWDTKWRQLGLTAFMITAQSQPDIATALRAHEALTQAAALSATLPREHQGIANWALGALTGNTDAQTAAKAGAKRPSVRLILELDQALRPDDPSTPIVLTALDAL